MMRSDAGRYAERFRENITDLRDRFGWLLVVYESRDVDSVRAAERAYLEWAAKGADDLIEALTYAYESQVECGPRWSDDPRALHEDFALIASPAWDLFEMYLVAGLVLSKTAETLQDERAEGIDPAAALLYADAVDALAAWTRLRGFDGCRNPNTRLGEMAHAAAESGKRVAKQQARSEVASKAGSSRLPEYREAWQKTHALFLEWKAGKYPKIRTNKDFGREAMRRWPVLTSEKVIEQRCAKWGKELKAARATGTPAF